MRTLTLAILVAVVVCATVCQTNGQDSSAGGGGGKIFDKMSSMMTKKMGELQKDGKMDSDGMFNKMVEFLKTKSKDFTGSDSNDYNSFLNAFKNMKTEGGSDKFKNLMKKMGGGDSAGGGFAGKMTSFFNKKKN